MAYLWQFSPKAVKSRDTIPLLCHSGESVSDLEVGKDAACRTQSGDVASKFLSHWTLAMASCLMSETVSTPQ